MTNRTTIQSETDIKLPLAFIVYGLFALAIAQGILFFSSDFLLSGQFRIPDIWMGAHFLLLGFAVMIAMGAMYQLVPVAFLTPIWNQKFGYVQFIITAIGIGWFAISLGTSPSNAIYGGILTVIGITLFIIQMANTIIKQKNKNIMTYFVTGAIISFFLTIVAGFLLAWNFAFGGISSHQTILFSHIALGVAGWFTLLIFGFSYKLVPMFSLSHGFSMKWAKPAFITYLLGLAILISSFWINMKWIETIGWLLLFLGFGFFSLDMREILSKRIKKKLDKPFTFSLFAILNGLIIHFLALMVAIFPIGNQVIWSWLIFLYIMAWIIFSILGYLYKIVPFLWWTYKYAERNGKEKVPTLKDMINERLSVILFTFLTIGIVGLTTGALLEIGMIVYIFQGIITVASLVYVLSIVRVLLK